MIKCPDFLEQTFPMDFHLLMYVVSILTLLINPYVIYCIIFRSTKEMQKYRWYLLYHQLACLVSDVWLHLIDPVLFLPFSMGYPRGPVSGVIPSHYMTVSVFVLCLFSLATSSHLFCYRYLVVLGHQKYPKKCILILAVVYISVFVPPITSEYSKPDVRAVVEELSQYFSCITPRLLEIPNFIVYSYSIMFGFAIPTGISVIFIFSASFYFIFSTLSRLNWTSASDRTMRQQKKFLKQLVLQVFVPLFVLTIPAAALFVIAKFLIFGTSFVSLILAAAAFSFSITGGLVLIFMNKTYHPFKRGSTQVIQLTE